jgi:hypothetical protein
MSLRTAAALALAATLIGCPLPQPLPDYPAGTVTPPRILTGTPTRDGESILPVPAGCPTGPTYALAARIYYQDSVTKLAARWFVDYRPDVASRYAIQNANTEVPANSNSLLLERDVPGFTFRPYEYGPPSEAGGGTDPTAAGVVHVVELVVSNGFDADVNTAEPNRTPAVVPGSTTRFEIQTHRWVFVTVAPSAAVPCP